VTLLFVSNLEQAAGQQECMLFAMDGKEGLSAMDATTQILGVVRDGSDGVIVTFSDGTTAGYVVEELLMLRPVRQGITGLLKPHKPVRAK
jgi:hypothetical protein